MRSPLARPRPCIAFPNRVSRWWNCRNDQLPASSTIAVRSGYASASCASLAPICTSPPREHDAANDRALFHHGVAFGRARERQHGSNERLDCAGGEEMERYLDVLVGGIAGARDADAPHDHEAGIDLDALAADVAEDDHDGVLRGRAQALAEGVGDDVLQHNVDALLAGAAPDLAREFQVRADDHLVGAGLPDDFGLVFGAGDRNRVCVHALDHLNLMQAQTAASASNEHRLTRLDLRHAERGAYAGADRADRERRSGHIEAVRYTDGIARGHAGELGITTAAALAQHAAVAAKVLPAAQAIAAQAAIEPLIDDHALTYAVGRHICAGLDDLAGDLVAENATGLAPGNLAAAREHVVIADPGGMNANENVIRAGHRPLDHGCLQHRRGAKIRECDGFHRGHGLVPPI